MSCCLKLVGTMSLLLGCASSHAVDPGDGGIDAQARRPDAWITDAGRDAARPANYCALANVRYPDGTPQPTCSALGMACGDLSNLPQDQGLCQFGLCCSGTVLPSTCECSCGLGPACRGDNKACCRPDPSRRPDLGETHFYCLNSIDCLP
jgi:hypothetical protein